jgi:hypothetical protein
MLTDGINKVAVSTIVEHMFQYFDEDLILENGQYSQLERGLKLRAALLIFSTTVLPNAPMLINRRP